MILRCAARRAARALPAAAVALGAAAADVHAAPRARYLVIGASDASPAGIARRAAALADTDAAGAGPGLVLSTADCGERRAVFAWAAAVADSAAAAQAVLARLQARAPDAYVKRCTPRSGSLLALGVPAVHASIAGVPGDAVNWSDADRVSDVLSLGPPHAPARLVRVRHHVVAADDPLEGRRTRVLLALPGATPQLLLDECSGAGGAVRARGWLALACDSEQAADQVLHTVHAFTAAGVPVTQVPRCRQPRISGADTLVCLSESVDARGRLRLRTRVVKLTRL